MCCDRFRTSWRQWLPALAASTAMINVGTDTYWLRHALENAMPNPNRCTWCAIGLLIGVITSVIFGTISGALCTDKLGRHKSLLIGASLGILPITGFFAPTSVWPWITLYFGEIAGVITRIALPVYVSEIVDDNIRGAALLFQMTLLAVGKVMGETNALYAPPYVLSIAAGIIFIVYIATFSRYPDTPYYYVMQKRYDRAKESLAVFKGITPSVKNEAIDELTNAVEANGNEQGFYQKIRKLFSGRNLKGLLIIIVLLVVRLNESVFDAQTWIFLLSWVGGMHVHAAMIILYSLVLPWNIVLVFVIDSVGRRSVIVFSIIGGFVAVTVFITLHKNFWLLVATNMFLHLCQTTLYAIPTIFVAEFFPTNIKATASALIVCLEETIKWSNLLLRLAFKEDWSYIVFLCGLCLSIVLIIIFIPETKKKSYVEIQNDLDRPLIFGRFDVKRYFQNRTDRQTLVV